MKKLVGMIMIVIMILSFGACNEQEKPAQKSLYEQGLDVVSMMEEAVHLDNYAGKFTDNFEEKIEEQNKKITHIIWIIFVSMITAVVTTLALIT